MSWEAMLRGQVHLMDTDKKKMAVMIWRWLSILVNIIDVAFKKDSMPFSVKLALREAAWL